MSTSQSFQIPTDTAATTAGIPGLCGPRYYEISDETVLSFVSIVPPAAGLDPVANSWTLLCLSGNLAEVGVWNFYIKYYLSLYPTDTVIQPVTVTVLHVCASTVIQPQTFTPVDFQIRFSVREPVTIFSFAMHEDTVAVAY